MSTPLTGSKRIKCSSPAKSTTAKLQSTSPNRQLRSTVKKNLRDLRKSNLMLEKMLEERKMNESYLEIKLAQVGASLKRAKDVQLQQTVRLLSSSLFFLLVLLVSYLNWRMFSPHFDAMIMGLLVSSTLRNLQTSIIHLVDRLLIASWLKPFLFSQLLMAMLFVYKETNAYSISILGLSVTICLLVSKKVPSRMLSSIVLTVVVVSVVCLPLIVVVRSSAIELNVFAQFALRVLEDQEQIKTITEKLNRFPFLRVILEQSSTKLEERIRVEPQDVNNIVKYVATAAGTNSIVILDLVTNASNLVWGFGVFSVTLFSLLQVDLEIYKSKLASFSPFSAHDNDEVYATVTTSTYQVFVGSVGVGFIHGFVMYVTLNILNCPLIVLPAFASSCLAVAPLFGSFVIWLPFAIIYYLLDQTTSAVMLVLFQLILTLLIDPLIGEKFPSSAKYLGGLPTVAGLFAFGIFGIIYGPLVVGISVTISNIYLRYISGNITSYEEDEGEDETMYPEESFMTTSSAKNTPKRVNFLSDASFISSQR